MHSYWTNKLGHPPGWGVAPALSGIVPVDVDVKEGKPGQRYFDWFDLAYGWPETLRSQSPSGGFHLWYRGPHVYALGTSTSNHPGIDFAQYLVLPGSRRRDGRMWRWTNDAPIAPAPQWLFEIARRKDRVSVAQRAMIELDLPANIQWAKHYLRHDAPLSNLGDGGEFAVFDVAATMKDHGISFETAVDLMIEIYNTEEHCNPVWDDLDEFRAKIANGFKYATRFAPGEDTAQANFFNDDVDVDAVPTHATAQTIEHQKDQRRKLSRARVVGRPKSVLSGGYIKTGKYVWHDGVRVPVLEKVKS
jgi:hypothetical protein